MGFRVSLIFIFLSWFLSNALSAQVNPPDTTPQGNNQLYNKSGKLIRSINENKSDEEIAEDYFNLSMELAREGNYEKAEQYIRKAIEHALKVKKSTRLSVYYREMARIQELQGKQMQSVENYQKASDYTDDKAQKRINQNDAQRVKKPKSSESELLLLQQNVNIMNTNPQSVQNSNEISRTYVQMANVNASMNQPEMAIDNYKNALSATDINSNEYFEIQGAMAELLANNNNIDEAIELQKDLVKQSEMSGIKEIQVRQMQQLSNLYFANNIPDEGLKLLQDAYTLALESGNLREAKNSLLLLVDFYKKQNSTPTILQLYENFITGLDSLIAKDRSLVDIRLFQVNEERIEQLEQEKILQVELIHKKNTFNYVLIASVLLLILFIIFMVRARRSIMLRNKQIALQSLRREMNPHFLFNSLNSINSFIARNNELEANKYLTSYSSLLRNMMENSNTDFVLLSTEIELLNKYLSLEKLRFEDAFEYQIEVDASIDPEVVRIPNLLIQPHLENAIWHGLRYKEQKGMLSVHFINNREKHTVIIEDNGIGLGESKRLKTKNQQMHQSRGMNNVSERIRLLNELYGTDITLEITDKPAPGTGVIVKLEWI